MAWPSTQHALAQDLFGDELSANTNGTGQFTRNLDEINDLLRSSSVHESTGVAELHRSNITGHGITIAILDSGVDYYHRALGGGFGDGYKVTYGRDLVGTKGQSELDPYNDCRYHGTHVTGIAVGKDPLIDWVGVAPDAKVEHYRIAACGDINFETDTIIKALLEAHERKVDVISMSISLHTGPFTDGELSLPSRDSSSRSLNSRRSSLSGLDKNHRRRTYSVCRCSGKQWNPGCILGRCTGGWEWCAVRCVFCCPQRDQKQTRCEVPSSQHHKHNSMVACQ